MVEVNIQLNIVMNALWTNSNQILSGEKCAPVCQNKRLDHEADASPQHVSIIWQTSGFVFFGLWVDTIQRPLPKRQPVIGKKTVIQKEGWLTFSTITWQSLSLEQTFIHSKSPWKSIIGV